MECQFVAGQKVVCIRHEVNPKWTPRGECFPTVGKMYTIRQIGIIPVRSYPLIWLNEIINQVLNYQENGVKLSLECGFPADCFRAVTETKTDISIFTKMLTTKFVEPDPVERCKEYMDHIWNGY